MANAKRDQNFTPTLLGVSNADGTTPVIVYADPTTHRLLVDSAGGGINVETPTGTVNGVNLIFTVLNTPKVVVIDNMSYFGSGDGYTYAAGTITCNGDRAPVSIIRSLY